MSADTELAEHQSSHSPEAVELLWRIAETTPSERDALL